MGDTAIQLIYGRGQFDLSSVVGTTHCLWGYSSGLIPMTLVLLLGPAFYARQDYRTPTLAAIFSVGLNVGLNGFFIWGLHWGPASVAWATSISAVFNCAYLLFALRGTMGSLVDRPFYREIGKLLLATSLATLSVLSLDSILGGSSALAIALHTQPPQLTFFQALTRGTIQFTAFSLIFLATARLLKTRDLLFWRAAKD